MTSASGAAGQASARAKQAGDSRALRILARFGLATQGVVYLLVALIAVQVAVAGGAGKRPDQSGALATVAKQPFGLALLWVLALGLFGFAGWQVTDVIWGVPGEDDNPTKKALGRGKAAGVAVAYIGLGITALKVATGSGSASSSSSTERSKTSTVLGWPGGQILVAVAGLVVIGIGVYSAVKGVRAGFEKRMRLGELDPRVRATVRWLGRVGYTARGVTFVIVGILVVVAAVRYQPGKAGGLDVALKTLGGEPYGPVLLGVVALGLACFGVFSFADARYRRL